MINYDAKQNVIKLDNGSINFVIYINQEGYLETIYFGKSVKDFDVSSVRITGGEEHGIYSIAENKETVYPDGYKEGVAPVEISTHARKDKRGAPIIVKRENGSFVTDFRYVSHRIYSGIEELNGLPCAHGENCNTVEFLLKEHTRELYVKHRVTIFEDKDIIIKNFEIVNDTCKSVVLDRAMSMQLDLPGMDHTFNHFCGRWAEERTRVENEIYDGVTEIYSNGGASSAEENPFVFLKAKNADYDKGDIEPLIVVAPTFYSYGLYGDDDMKDIKDVTPVKKNSSANFGRELRFDIIPAVESEFSTYADGASESALQSSRDHRAMAGLSNGCRITYTGGMIENFDYISWFGCYSSSIDSELVLDALSSEKYKNYKLNYMFNADGIYDFAYNGHKKMVNELVGNGKFGDDNVEYVQVAFGYHSARSWRVGLYDSLQRFFKRVK